MAGRRIGSAYSDATALRRELDRVHEQIPEHLLEPAGVSADLDWRDIGGERKLHVPGHRQRPDGIERPLRHGDEIRIGRTRVVYRANDAAPDFTVTRTAEPPPELTRRERDVLVALCRPVLSADLFTEPASIRQIAEQLVVTEAAVKQHLLRLYDKFGVYDSGERRRVRLANEAIRRGAVTLADLRESSAG